MVQVLKAPERKPTIGQRLSQGIGRGLEMGSQLMQQRQAQEQQAQASKQLSDLVGFDVSHFPPEMQQSILVETLKGSKPLTPLQESQKALADERLRALQGQQEFFKKISGKTEVPSENIQDFIPQKHPQDFLTSISEDNLRQLSSFAGQPGEQGIIGNFAKSELDRREKQEAFKRKEFGEERAYHTQFSKTAEEEAESIRSALPKIEMSLDYARNAVESGEVGAFSLANLGERLGIKELQTAKGAQLVTAAKENLLGNLSRVSARAQNIWFEKRLNSMMAEVGKSKEANLSAQELLESEALMNKAYLNEFDRISAQDMDKYGFVKKDISKRARDASKTLEKEIFKRSTYRLKEIEEQEKGLSGLKQKVGKNVEKGTPLTLAMAKLYKDKFGDNALKMAEKNGYYIPTLEEFRIFQQRPQEFRERFSE